MTTSDKITRPSTTCKNGKNEKKHRIKLNPNRTPVVLITLVNALYETHLIPWGFAIVKREGFDYSDDGIKQW